jgi:hypothetical protein
MPRELDPNPGDGMQWGPDQCEVVLSRLVGCWEGTFRHRGAADRPFEESPGKSENRWVLGGRFVEMTLLWGLEGQGFSALFYIGYERGDRRYVVVSSGPGDRRVAVSRGEWIPDPGRLLLTSHSRSGEDPRQSRMVCDVRTPGALKLELAERDPSGEEFVRFRADYHAAARVPPVAAPRPPRRSVIA